MAAYEGQRDDPYAQHVAVVAKRWLALLDSPRPTQGVVDGILEELDGPVPDDYGCAWTDLKKQFLRWAVEEEWVK